MFERSAPQGHRRWLAAALLYLAAGLLADGAAGQDAQAPEPWREQMVNPQPAEGDFTLPMPCGGAMVFRRIDLPASGFLDDTRVQFGDADPELGFINDRRWDVIAGAFTDPSGPNRRYYWIGKYEVTVAQYEALMAGECPNVSMRTRLPMVDVSWFDAVSFSERYTEWLLGNARDSLPIEGEVPGFLRLPTEGEWEFAARGGMAVSSIDFIAARFPMPDGDPAAYIWYQGSQSAGGKLNPVGLLRPNPLGVYDILGNASEMIFEPFRLNKRGRLHGQAGGFIIRGGDFTVPLDQIRSGRRVELPYYSAREGQATQLRQLGFRLVLTAPAIVSTERLNVIEQEWASLPAPDPTMQTARQETDALATLATVSNQTADDQTRSTLDQIRRDLEDALAERNQARDRAVRALVNVGALFAQKLRTDRIRFDAVSRAIDDVAMPALSQLRERAAGRADAEQLVAEAEARVNEMNQQRDGLAVAVQQSLETYADMVFTIAKDYSTDVVDPQAAALKVELEGRNAAYLVRFVDLFVAHMAEYRVSGAVDSERWLQEIVR